jgi:UPF0755 protein
VGTSAGLTWRALHAPTDPDGAELVFEVEPGEPLGGVARRLGDAGLLPRDGTWVRRALLLFARVQGVERSVKSGEYDLSAAMTPVEILERLVSGRVKTYAVTIPEGTSLAEIALRFETAGVASAEQIVALGRDPEFTRSLGVEAPNLEGYLYPETYRFRRGEAPASVLEHMVRQFEGLWSAEIRAALDASELSRHEVVTLASIVEKETGAAEERPLIAGVFHNRLDRRMRLQSDPTVIYGILETRGEFDGNIRKRDLQTDTPWNTYTRGGIPPGPIASPGADAIRAVLFPEETNFLYFVSRNDGTHKFSATLREHVAAVDEYQRRRRRR